VRIYVGPTDSLKGEVRAPGSKNYTSRYIWLSALTPGESTVASPALNDDARALIECCRELGAKITEADGLLRIGGIQSLPKGRLTLNPGNGGLILRLLLAYGLLLPETEYVTSYPESLGKRPQGDLLTALRELGAEVHDQNGCLPIVIYGQKPVAKREVMVSGRVSSQFATALLFVAPLLGGLTVRITEGLASRPPLATTIKVMAEAGVQVEADWEDLIFTVPAGSYQPRSYRTPGDYPAASALLSAAVLLPSEVVLSNLALNDVQGERAVIPYLQKMGADLTADPQGIRIQGGRPLQAADFPGDQATDAVLSMAVVAALAEGTSRFRKIANLRWKESDRISDFARELRKVGVQVEEFPEELRITGEPKGYKGGVVIDAHHDHRIIMAFSALALRTQEGLEIDGAEHVSKSYPTFFADLAALGATVKVLDGHS